MKIRLFSILFLALAIYQANAQTSYTRFAGYWKWISPAGDTLKINLQEYLNTELIEPFHQLIGFYNYKTACPAIDSASAYVEWIPTGGYRDTDIEGVRPDGNQIKVYVTDKAKRKLDGFIFIVNDDRTQIQATRFPVTGGAVLRMSDQMPLPGFTLPASFMLRKYTVPSPP